MDGKFHHQDASSLLETLQKMNPPFEIDGRLINTLYAKNSEPAPTTKPRYENRMLNAVFIVMC